MSGVPGSWSVVSCTECGSGTTLPLVFEEALSAFYPADYTPFDVRPSPVQSAMRMVQRARDRRFPLSELVRAEPTGTAPPVLLDVGCGRGDLAASWIERGWRVIGVEPSPQAAAVARQRGADVKEGTLSTVDIDPGGADAAVMSHSLEHTVNPIADLRRVAAALRPGGRIAILVPNWGSWQRRRFGDRWFPLELPRHRVHFTAQGLAASLAHAGFEEIVVRPGTPLITTAWSLQLALFGRCLTQSGSRLLIGYGVAVPIAIATLLVDRFRGDGDFLHATAVRGPG